MKIDKMETVLKDDAVELNRHLPKHPSPNGRISPKSVKVRVECNGVFLSICPEGYGEKTAENGTGAPVLLEFYEGRLRLIVSPDINEEEPQIIDLEGARE